MIKTAKEAIRYASVRNHQIMKTTGQPMDNVLYINVPRNNDIVEVLDGIRDIYGVTPNDAILLLATTEEGFRSARMNGYSAVMIHAIMQLTPSTQLFVDKAIDKRFRYVVVENIDTFTSYTLSSITKAVPFTSTIFLLYDYMISKKHLDFNIAATMWRCAHYHVDKIGRDKSSTTTSMYNLRNKIRDPKNSLDKLLATTSYDNNVVIKHISSLDEVEMYMHMNDVIITPHSYYMVELNRMARLVFKTYYTSDTLPVLGEWIALHEPGIARDADGNNITLPAGYRFKIKNMLPINNDKSLHCIFDYKTIDKQIIEASININLEYFYYLMNAGDSVSFPERNDDVYAYYGYAITNTTALNHIYDKATVVLNYEMSHDKEPLYSCVSCIQNNVTILNVRR